MKERPILFSAPMVRALLDGTKTQTRRAVKLQPSVGHEWAGWCVSSTCSADEGKATWARGTGPLMVDAHRVRCPYGQPGDRLWVREAWATHAFLDDVAPRDLMTASVHYSADGTIQTGKGRPSIHMPRKYSRIDLEVTGVRVERLQDISEADAIAEGIERNWSGDLGSGPNGCGGEGWVPECGWRHYLNSMDGDPAYTAVESYRSLWEQINGDGSWAANPWLWVVEFKVANP